MGEAPSLDEILKRLEAVEQKLGIVYIPNAETKIEELVEKIDPKKLEFVLRHVDAKDLELAMAGFKASALLKIKAAVSPKSWGMLADDLQVLIRQGISDSSAKEARRKIMSIIKQTAGEIPGYPPAEWETLKSEEWKKREEALEAIFKTQESLDGWKKGVFDKLV